IIRRQQLRAARQPADLQDSRRPWSRRRCQGLCPIRSRSNKRLRPTCCRLELASELAVKEREHARGRENTKNPWQVDLLTLAAHFLGRGHGSVRVRRRWAFHDCWIHDSTQL